MRGLGKLLFNGPSGDSRKLSGGGGTDEEYADRGGADCGGGTYVVPEGRGG